MKRKIFNYLFFKSIIDTLVAILLIIILSPILFFISIILFFFQDRNLIFSQKRPGYKSNIFNIYKFKTMKDIRNKEGILLEDIKRITLIGSFLRETSLDELPSLFNIAKGEMSFVGPRPLLVEYLKYYNSEELKRNLVKPGLTGWAQINGRNNSSWEKRFKLDIWYVNNLNLFIDIYILIITIWKVITKQGINRSKASTMPKFFRLHNVKTNKK